jgi:hypothetical protein
MGHNGSEAKKFGVWTVLNISKLNQSQIRLQLHWLNSEAQLVIH